MVNQLIYCLHNYITCTNSDFQSSLAAAGIGLAVVGFAGRYMIRQMPQMTQKMADAMQSLPKFDAESLASSKYYKGGFDSKMNKREASLILGVSPSASKIKVVNYKYRGFGQCIYGYSS